MVAMVGFWALWFLISDTPPNTPQAPPSGAEGTVENRASTSALPGDLMLASYASPTSDAQQDLTWLARVMDNFSLLVKGDTPIPLGANEEVALALLGKNRAQLAFISAGSPALNPQGQLIDRWGSPLFFHAESSQKIDVRSAGPDRAMWTSDDIHRCHDGSFLQGEKLNPPSLFIPPTR